MFHPGTSNGRNNSTTFYFLFCAFPPLHISKEVLHHCIVDESSSSFFELSSLLYEALLHCHVHAYFNTIRRNNKKTTT